jgi:hypothetical protein
MAAALELNVPRFRRFLVFGLIFREYNRYSPDFSLRIITFIFIIQYNKNAWAMNENDAMHFNARCTTNQYFSAPDKITI